jgi:hypothetical protein
MEVSYILRISTSYYLSCSFIALHACPMTPADPTRESACDPAGARGGERETEKRPARDECDQYMFVPTHFV